MAPSMLLALTMGTLLVLGSLAWRRRARTAGRHLAYLQSQLQATYELAAESVIVCDEEGRILACNPAGEELIGESAAALSGRPLARLLGIDPTGRHRERPREDGDPPFDVETRLLTADGRRIPVAVRVTAIRFLDQRRLVATIRDRREQARTEAELQGLFAAMDDIVLVLSDEGRYLKVPRTRTNRLYRPADDLLGRTVHEVLPEPAADAVLAVVRQTLAERRRVRTEYSLEMGGENVWFAATVSPLDERSVVWVARDVTAERRMEEQLRQVQKIEAVGQLAAGIAHDFNNLLTVIQTHADFLVPLVPSEGDGQEDLTEIRKATVRAAALIRQLLAYSRKQILKPTTFDLNEKVLEVRGMLARLIGEHIAIHTELREGPCGVLADPHQIEQVVINLAVNARDAMPRGGRLLVRTEVVRVAEEERAAGEAVEPGDYVVLTVTDTGKGMSPEVQRRIFEPFFTTKHPGQGTGLGLATVHGIVRQSRGHIDVCSTPGVGSSFRVLLPLHELEGAEAGVPGCGVQPRGEGTVLLVEDEEAVRSAARRTLERCGYTVFEAGNGCEALETAATIPGPIDLLLTDAVMPEMGGRQLADRLGPLHPGMRVLFMSGYTDDVVIHGGLAARSVALIEKPFTLAALLERVRSVLDGSDAGLEVAGGVGQGAFAAD